MFFESAAGIELDIQAGVSATLPIPEFYIEPGTYPFLYVQLSSKLGMKWSGRFSNDVDGSSGDGNGGTYCWTSNAGIGHLVIQMMVLHLLQHMVPLWQRMLKQWTVELLKAAVVTTTRF